MNFFINTREAKNERPHVHVSLGKGKRKGDMKIWLDDLELEYAHGFKTPQVREACKLVESMREEFLAEYERYHGKAVAR